MTHEYTTGCSECDWEITVTWSAGFYDGERRDAQEAFEAHLVKAHTAVGEPAPDTIVATHYGSGGMREFFQPLTEVA